jgi:hypothetical protein
MEVFPRGRRSRSVSTRCAAGWPSSPTRPTTLRGSTRWRSQGNKGFSLVVPSFRNHAGRRASILAPCKLKCEIVFALEESGVHDSCGSDPFSRIDRA